MGKLLLDSLEIQNFRGFRNLQIEKLGRVNLIVGKNNIGKSSLLEALELYARRGVPALIWQLLRARKELRETAFPRREDDIDDLLESLKYLFYGMEEVAGNSPSLRIGSMNVLEETVTISLGWFAKDVEQHDGLVKWRRLLPEEYLIADNPIPRLSVDWGKQNSEYPLQRNYITRMIDAKVQAINYSSIKAEGLDDAQTLLLWDKVTLTDWEEEVINALRIIAPGVKDLSFVGYSGALSNPVPHIRIEKMDKPLPLGTLGNGIYRFLGIVLAMVNAKDGLLLIDEIENGIHYSVQHELWELIFRLARRLNVQVFATTHSWDCIEGLQQAAEKDKQGDGMLIRLSLKKDDEIKTTLFDERRMGIATRERIEVR
jgi:AAA ATPase-like protein